MIKSSILNKPLFQDENSAREYLESVRWPKGPVCLHCSNKKNIYKLEGEAHRKGVYKCSSCRKQFTVTVGTLYEKSKIKLNIWLQATYLLSSSKKGISSHQLHRMLGVTYKTAWFMTHRIWEAMKDPVFAKQLGGSGKVVEVDETFWGNKSKPKERGDGAIWRRYSLSLNAAEQSAPFMYPTCPAKPSKRSCVSRLATYRHYERRCQSL